MIASHYAVPLPVALEQPATLHAAADEGSEVLGHLEAGSEMRILDKRGDWAWGYAGNRVGYVRAQKLA